MQTCDVERVRHATRRLFRNLDAVYREVTGGALFASPEVVEHAASIFAARAQPRNVLGTLLILLCAVRDLYDHAGPNARRTLLVFRAELKREIGDVEDQLRQDDAIRHD